MNTKNSTGLTKLTNTFTSYLQNNKPPIQLLLPKQCAGCLPHEPSLMALMISYPVAYL